MAETARQSSPGPRVNVSNSLMEFSGAESDSLVAPAEYDIHSTDLHTAPGVTLDEKQTLLTGSVLDVRLESPVNFRAPSEQTHGSSSSAKQP